jgi:mRNA interferase MazF
MNQGDVYWYTFRAPDKRRPVLILTRNSAVPFLTGVTVAPLTTTVRGIPSEVLLTHADDGVPADCVVNVDNIQTVQKSGLATYVTHLSLERMREVRAAIEFALGFDALT